MKYALLIASLLLAGCSEPRSREEAMFDRCTNSINSSSNPGYSEIVKACADAAARISGTPKATAKED